MIHVPFDREAQAVVAEQAANVRQGSGFDGRALAPKRRPDGQPVGGPGMARLVEGATVTVRPDGFDLSWDNPALEAFHEGNSHQPARPVIGWTPARVARATKAALLAVVDHAVTRLGFKRVPAGRR